MVKTPDISPMDTPLIEVAGPVVPPIPDSTRIREVADQNPITEYDDRTSDAARDQGHGPQEWGVPLEDEDHPRRKPEAIAAAKAAKAKRRRRVGHRENRFFDIGKDIPPQIKAAEEFEAEDGSTGPVVEMSLETRELVQKVFTDSSKRVAIRDAKGDEDRAKILEQAREDRAKREKTT